MAKPLYRGDWRAKRKAWNQELTRLGSWTCRRCGQPVYPDHLAHLNPDGSKFDLGHPEVEGEQPEPEHARKCNRSAGGRKAQQMARQPASEEWW